MQSQAQGSVFVWIVHDRAAIADALSTAALLLPEAENAELRSTTLEQSQTLNEVESTVEELSNSLQRERTERQKLEVARAAISQEVLHVRPTSVLMDDYA